MNIKIQKKKKVLVYSLSLLLLMALAVSADDAKVSRLNLSPQANEMVLKIDVSGPFQFVHETAEAKNGKPFRVVVDIFPAIHDLGQKDFVDLPKTMLSSIRTSQYSTNPENIVRVVCDLDQTVMYRIEKKGSSIYLYLPDKNSGNFASWSNPVKAPVTVAKVLNNTKEEPAKKVVKKKVVRKVKTTPPPAKNTEKELAVVNKRYQTKSSDFIDHDKFLSTQNSPQKTPQVAVRQDAVEQAPVKQDAVAKDVVRKVVAVASTQSAPVQKTKIEKKATVAKSKVVKNELTAKKKVVHKTVTTKPVVKSKSTVTTAVAPAKQKTVKKEMVKVAPPKSEPKSGQPVQEFTMVKKPVSAKKATKKESTKAAPVVKKSETKPIEVASTEVRKTEKSKDKQKPTSRFRRKPSFPTKLKGTIVAEFPTRIVMKYRPGTGRDPFKNLLTDTKGNNSPIQKKIPDVETAKLVGILESADGKKRALLEDHDGYGYILKSGDKIKKGYVGKIYSDKAYFKLFEYGWSRTVALYMSIN